MAVMPLSGGFGRLNPKFFHRRKLGRALVDIEFDWKRFQNLQILKPILKAKLPVKPDKKRRGKGIKH